MRHQVITLSGCGGANCAERTWSKDLQWVAGYMVDIWLTYDSASFVVERDDMVAQLTR